MRILVTGGTGSLGRVLVRNLAHAGHHVTVFSRDAHKQAALQRALHEQNLTARFILGDICDPVTITRACAGQDWLVHAAAIKRIERGETDPDEYTRVNVQGTAQVVQAALQNHIQKALLICTDKAVSPLNTYGITKALAERIWTKAHQEHETQFAAIRYGNVINSDGAVLHLWREQAALGQPLTVREPEPTRFVLTIDHALTLVLEALEQLQNGQVLIPRDLPAISVWEMARIFQPESCWRKESLTPGEKQHESLLANGEFAYVASPHLAFVTTTALKQPTLPHTQFQSNTTQRLSTQELKHLLAEGVVRVSSHRRTGEQLVAT